MSVSDRRASAPASPGCSCAPTCPSPGSGACWCRCRWCSPRSSAPPRSSPGSPPDGVLRELLELVGYDAPQRFRGLGAVVARADAVHLPLRLPAGRGPAGGAAAELEESARLLGDRPWRSFRRVVLPALRPSVLGGMLLVFLYCLSEFGAVQLLGYDTLTRVVYATRLLDRATSFAAATVLLVARRWSPSPANGGCAATRRPVGPRPPLGATARSGSARGGCPALLSAVAGLIVVALAVPLRVARRSGRGGASQRDGEPVARARRASSPTWPGRRGRRRGSASSPARSPSRVVLPVALLVGPLPQPAAAAWPTWRCVGGFAVPGVVIALEPRVLVAQRAALRPPLPDGPVAARRPTSCTSGRRPCGPPRWRSAAVPDRLRESARLLGARRGRAARCTVELPLMRPGLLAGGGLVLLSTVKELPATLLLAPIGLRDADHARCGAPSRRASSPRPASRPSCCVAVSGVLTWLLVLRRAHHLA